MTTDEDPNSPPPGSIRLSLTETSAPHAARPGRPARVNLIVLAYLLAALITTGVGDVLPVPRWLALHLLLLGAATNAVMIWSAHFAGALLHARADSRHGEPFRLALLNAGVLFVLSGVGWGLPNAMVLMGAGLVAVAALAHLGALLRLRRVSLGGPLAPTTWFYVAAAASLVVGAALGGAMGTNMWAAGHDRMHLAHAHVNLLGWLGLSVQGSLFMLWPAVLGTRIAEGAPRLARRALTLTVTGLVVAVAGLLVGVLAVAVAGLALYGTGVAFSLHPFVSAARMRPPRTAAAWMLAGATTWLVVAIGADVLVLASGGQAAALELLDAGLPVFGLGFVAQVLAGALTFLLPAVLGRGPEGKREVSALLDQAWQARVAALNLGVLLLSLRLGRDVDLVAWILLVAAAASFVLLAMAAFLPRPRRGWVWVASLVLVPLFVLGAGRGLAPAGVDAVAVGSTGARTVIAVLHDFSVAPARITVPSGTRLRLDVRNEGHRSHDLKVDGTRGTRRLAAHERQTIDLGVVTRALRAWCTLAAHRQAGMVLDIVVVGSPSAAPTPAASTWNPSGTPAPGWQPYDAALRPAPGGREHRITMRVQERDLEVAPGAVRRMWTFGGTVPGPVLHGRVGDLFTVRLVNDGTMPHSLDFHASEVAPNVMMRSIEPGQSLVYQFRAVRAGIWMYHCGTSPLLQHVANGMYGAVIVDPPGLPKVDREYVLVQSELYLDGTLAAAKAVRPDAVVFNGYADQYRHAPLRAQPGDRIRIWVLDAGPSNPTAFHVVGAQFDTVYKEGAYFLRDDADGGAQALDLAPSQGGFVELTIAATGQYPFLTHRLADATSGAVGVLVVGTGSDHPDGH